MKFARCQECGNTETFTSEVPWCDGAGDALRRHARTRMQETDQEAVVDQFGGSEEAEKALGLEEGSLANAQPSDTAKSTDGPDLFAGEGPEATDTPHDPTNAVPEGDPNTNTVSEEQLAAQGWTRNDSGGWNPPANS